MRRERRPGKCVRLWTCHQCRKSIAALTINEIYPRLIYGARFLLIYSKSLFCRYFFPNRQVMNEKKHHTLAWRSFLDESMLFYSLTKFSYFNFPIGTTFEIYPKKYTIIRKSMKTSTNS